MPALVKRMDGGPDRRLQPYRRRATDRRSCLADHQPAEAAPTFAMLLPPVHRQEWRVVRSPAGQRLETAPVDASSEDIIKAILCISLLLLAALATIPFLF